MVLNGLIILKEGGIPFYSKFVDINITMDSLLLGSFFTAMQNFAKEIDENKDTFIKEMQIHELIFLYREIEFGLFVGITKDRKDLKSTTIVFEYMIWSFISKFRSALQEPDPELSQFQVFDDLFMEYRTSKEKELQKWLQKESIETNLLQRLLTNLLNYFPIKEIMKVNSKYLKIIGNKLILVSLKISKEEESKIIEDLKNKVAEIYGPEMFDTLLNS